MRTTVAVQLVMILPLALSALVDADAGPQPKEKRLQFQELPATPVYDTAFSPDGKLLAIACYQKGIIIYDTATGEKRTVIPTMDRGRSVAFSPDGKTLVAGGGDVYAKPNDPGEMKIWDVQTGKELVALIGQGGIWKVAFTPDGKSVVSASGDSTIKIWDPATGLVKATLTDHKGSVRTFAFSPDGKIFASGGFDGAVIFWDAGTFKKIKTFQPHPQAVQCVVFAPSGQRFATCEWSSKANHKSEVKIWDVATGQAVGHIQDISKIVLNLAFSADERLLAISGGDKSKSADVKLIEVASGKARAILKGHKQWVESIRFSPDGRYVVGGGGNDNKKAGELSAWYLADYLQLAKPTGELSAKEVDSLWYTLADGDAVKAYRAIGLLVASPAQTLALFKERVKHPAGIDEKIVANLLKQLDDDDFEVREKATKALSALGEPAQPLLLKALKDNPSLEVRTRVQMALNGMAGVPSSHVQIYRAMEVLELIGTPPAKAVLETLAKGPANARITQEAQITLKRHTK